MPRGIPNNREITPDDIPQRALPPIDLSVEGMANRAPETIVQVEADPHTEYLDALKFAEEMVLIRLERTSEKHQAPGHQFAVNGRTWWIPVNKPWVIPRKVLEVIIRSQPFHVDTDVGDATMEHPHNKIVRFPNARYPCSVLRDDNPRGFAWLQKVAVEA